MDILQILAIILLSCNFMVGFLLDGKETEISFTGSTVWVIAWSLILYYGGFWG